MRNVKDLRNELIDVFDELKRDNIDVVKAKELNNSAGKILTSVKVQLAYNQFLDRKQEIDFLEV